MGVSLSFLAVKGLTSTEVHRALGITDTGVAAGEFDYPRPAMHGAALPDGWYLVLLNSVDHRFVTSEEIPARLPPSANSQRGCARSRQRRIVGRGKCRSISSGRSRSSSPTRSAAIAMTNTPIGASPHSSCSRRKLD